MENNLNYIKNNVYSVDDVESSLNKIDGLYYSSFLLNDSKYAHYTVTQEKETFNQYNSLTDKSKKINLRNEIIEHNLLLVRKIISKYRYLPFILEPNDLYSYGVEGLMVAIDKFDIDKQVKFSTYAYFWIDIFIRRAIYSLKRPIKISLVQNEKILMLKKNIDALTSKLKRKPTYKEICLEYNLSMNYIFDVLNSDSSFISMDQPVLDNEDLCLDEILYVPQENIEDIIFMSDLKKKISECINKYGYDERQIDVLLMKFGFSPYNYVYSYNEIAAKYNISYQRAEQIVFQLISKMKNDLSSYYEDYKTYIKK